MQPETVSARPKVPSQCNREGFLQRQASGTSPPPTSTKVVPLISPYLGNFDSSNIVHTTKELIASSSSQRLQEAFKDTKIVQCYTQTPNFLRILSSSRFTSSTSKENGVFRCNSSKCEICKLGYLQEGKSFITSDGRTWDVKCHITCHSLNVLYFLVCNFCQAESKLGKTISGTVPTITGLGAGKERVLISLTIMSTIAKVPHFRSPFFACMSSWLAVTMTN